MLGLKEFWSTIIVNAVRLLCVVIYGSPVSLHPYKWVYSWAELLFVGFRQLLGWNHLEQDKNLSMYANKYGKIMAMEAATILL